MTDNRPLVLVLLLAAGFLVVRVGVLVTSSIGLAGDEAQYWSWAQDLAWGYYTKPPMIAGVIAATTSVCGDDPWCVRLGSPLLHSVTAVLIYAGAVRIWRTSSGYAGAEIIGIWAALLWLSLPAVSFSSYIVSTDVPLLTSWSLALVAHVRVLQEGPDSSKGIWWAVLLGLALGLGLLAKYAMGYFLLCAVLHALFTGAVRWWLTSRALLISLIVGLAILSPNLVWNIESGWVTFVHVLENTNTVAGEGAAAGLVDYFRFDKLGEFLGSQFGVFGPVVFAVYLWRVVRAVRVTPSDGERFLLFFSLPILAIVTVQAFLSRANANWAATAYPAATLLVAGVAVEMGRRALLGISVAIHLVAALVLSVFFLDLPDITPPLKSDPLRKLRAWDAVVDSVVPILDAEPDRILLAEDRTVMAQLHYVLRDTPYRPLMWNYDEDADNHYELAEAYTPAPNGRALVVTEWDNPFPLLDQFWTVEALPPLRIPIGAGRERVIYRFKIDQWIGREP